MSAQSFKRFDIVEANTILHRYYIKKGLCYLNRLKKGFNGLEDDTYKLVLQLEGVLRRNACNNTDRKILIEKINKTVL